MNQSDQGATSPPAGDPPVVSDPFPSTDVIVAGLKYRAAAAEAAAAEQDVVELRRQRDVINADIKRAQAVAAEARRVVKALTPRTPTKKAAK
jgi:hypothetical protein